MVKEASAIMGSNKQGAISHIKNSRKCIHKGGECPGRLEGPERWRREEGAGQFS